MDALEIIRRTGARSRRPGTGKAVDGRAVANVAIGLMAGLMALIWTARLIPAWLSSAWAGLIILLLALSLVLAIASVIGAPRRLRGWVSVALWLAIVAMLIGLTIASDDFGR